MANTATVSSQERAVHQFQGLFSEMWLVKASISDQDAVTATDTAEFSLTVNGVALGDMVLGVAINNDMSDGTDFATLTGIVTAANTVKLRVTADAGEYAADDLNGATVNMLIGRPNW